MTYRLSAAHLQPGQSPRAGWSRVHLPVDVGPCFVDRLQLDDGVSLLYSEYTPRLDLLEESVFALAAPVLTMTVGLQGTSGYVGGDGTTLRFAAGHVTTSRAWQAHGHRRCERATAVRQLRLVLEPLALRRYGLGALLAADGRRGVQALGFVRCSAASALLAQRLAAADGDDPLRRLDMQMAAMGIVAEQARQLLRPGQADTGLRGADQRRLRQARDLMEQAFDTPLTVRAVCRQVGLNEFALKQGFHALFGTTPHRMLTGIRMRHAQALLAAGEPVTTVAARTGFQHASSFSAAYRRYFGHAPSRGGRPC